MWLRLKMMADVSTCSPAFHPLHPQKEELASLVHRLVQSLTFWNLTFAPIRLQIVDQIWCHCSCIYILTFPETAQDACIHILYVMLTVYACSANLLAWNYTHRLQIIPNDVSARLQVETLQNTVPTQKWCTREASPSFSGWRGCHAGLVTQGCRQWQSTRWATQKLFCCTKQVWLHGCHEDKYCDTDCSKTVRRTQR